MTAEALTVAPESGRVRIMTTSQAADLYRVETTMIYLRRLDRRRSMETVRGLDWGANVNANDSGRSPVASQDARGDAGSGADRQALHSAPNALESTESLASRVARGAVAEYVAALSRVRPVKPW